ncbi:RING/U-box superfamily protein [Raphanus sativus]|uniref:RING-type E3 ubiquitin transferase n=1 Tax=Raphanus sativus TaxID=3726 RepID=A0A6J0MZQ8_RAPSA|nr:probable E3 ubiquitin-protein ligase RHG1A [Raphanus sativus]XP_018477222.1 probable E3 ubiquitin-protein ligase RHG1A [Raphanus sativus]XP_018477223.1 probable E3 ubiquitin-protein ligase RHG1A [Raphanus sativus]XP_018477224.1 probable E3 ubiquitin-protein ligase RHG1A [Raphanus sativus]XP_018477226.1 probable E3 ubiquitin-protein ligase RHG1A [Raphanus sativus]XP_056864820.1 probable E3 ubiquitin-protein ligase RHG1A [Raphanus sativus]XP_056864821.1 probable E3 ubiquitin-protein ligase R
MGHRHFPGSSQLFDDEHDQGWNHIHPEHPYTSLERTGASENRSHFHPSENMLSEGMPVSSHWNSSTGPNAYTASGHGVERPHYNPGTSCPSHVPFMSSAAATFSAPHEHYVTSASSSYWNSQTWSFDSYVGLPMENARGAQKRKKNPCDSSVYEMGSSSHYNSERTSSDSSFPWELHMGKSTARDHDPHYMPRLMNPGYRSNNLSNRGESSSRNVRSRPTLDLETSVSLGLDSRSKHQNGDHCSSGHFPVQASHVDKDWNFPRHFPVPRDIIGFSPETNNFLPLRNVVNSTSVDTSGYHQGTIGNRNYAVSHGFPRTSSASTSRFSHRSTTPTYRSGLRLGHVASSYGDRSHFVTETYPSRPLWPPPPISLSSSDGPGRRRSSYERFQSPFDEVALNERFSSQRFMGVDHQPHYGSRNMQDHHRDMRLDIDDMTYEDLLDLGERIGSVNTGLSNGAITSCLLETILYPTDDQRKCAICLEEYKEGEELGELKGCGHDYHGGCIKKWLSLKNSCPICKSPAFFI